MKSIIITSFLILTLILVFPEVNAQSEPLREASQKMVQVTIDSEGNVSVAHQVRNSNEPVQLNFVEGTISNLVFIDRFGIQEPIDVFDGMEGMPILANQGEFFVKYDLDDALVLKDGFWTLDFRYLETTEFILPKEVNLLFVNERPVLLDGKSGITCHGCQMILEYSFIEPEKIQQVNWEDREFIVEMKTFAEIENFDFNQPAKKISFSVVDENRYVTTTIPLELLWGPYIVLLNDEKIPFYEISNDGTHVSLSMKAETSGEISIIGTTVVPEFSIIAPLAIGFLMVIMLPFLRKVNLH